MALVSWRASFASHLVSVVVPAVGSGHDKHPVFSRLVLLLLGGICGGQAEAQAEQEEDGPVHLLACVEDRDNNMTLTLTLCIATVMLTG